MRRSPDVVLDDDPTGVQAVADVPVLFDFSPDRITAAAARGAAALHLVTNVRALAPEAAERLTVHAAAAARAALPQSRIVLRGDSTLRGHLLEEYRALRRALYGDAGAAPVVLLVPALPAAGRVTLDGVQWLVDDHGRTPLHETEYARDGCFAYGSARLLFWAQERTAGLMDARDGTEVPLAHLRDRGGAAVCEAILAAGASGRPAACAPDAETEGDLELIADGLRRAEDRGARVIARCAPAFAGVLAGTLARRVAPAPEAGVGGVLIVCGSYVSRTTRQLDDLRRELGVAPIEPDLHALSGAGSDAEVARVAERAARALATARIALVATPRRRPRDLTSLDAGERIAQGLAAVVARLDPLPDVVVAKGGITSHVVVRDGLGAREAHVVGPVAPGVSLWDVPAGGRRVAYLVFPGNVGGAGALTRIVRLVTGGRRC
jgi:uncharacterized protein YgbK (DUF1537 family)